MRAKQLKPRTGQRLGCSSEKASYLGDCLALVVDPAVLPAALLLHLLLLLLLLALLLFLLGRRCELHTAPETRPPAPRGATGKAKQGRADGRGALGGHRGAAAAATTRGPALLQPSLFQHAPDAQPRLLLGRRRPRPDPPPLGRQRGCVSTRLALAVRPPLLLLHLAVVVAVVGVVVLVLVVLAIFHQGWGSGASHAASLALFLAARVLGGALLCRGQSRGWGHGQSQVRGPLRIRVHCGDQPPVPRGREELWGTKSRAGERLGFALSAGTPK